MRRLRCEAGIWAEETFGSAQLGDSRRNRRLVLMAARALQSPAGKVTEAIRDPAELQGAYDFLETGHIAPRALLQAVGASTIRRGAQEPFLYVSVDGSSLTLTDRAKSKGFGSIGPVSRRGRGLKVINALAISPDGVPVGLCAQAWWSRTTAKSRTPQEKKRHKRARDASEKETRFWLEAIDDSCDSAETTETKLWFVLDREADNRDILRKLDKTGHRFTVRASSDRLIQSQTDARRLRQQLALEPTSGSYELQVKSGPKRKPRSAHMVVRYAKVTLRLPTRSRTKQDLMTVTAVWAREQGTTPPDEQPIDWLLLTNENVGCLATARNIIFGYALRWRVEEFHKTWKTGACNVESSQLRSKLAVILWATILAAVAVRIERIKGLARKSPALPATVDLSKYEIQALLLLKRQQKKRTETIPNVTPTIGQATIWIAELGGYTGKSSGGPPGSITIRRGLDRVVAAAQALQALEAERRSDQ